MTRAGLSTMADLERIANQALANGWPAAVSLGLAVPVIEVGTDRIITALGVLRLHPTLGYWYAEHLATGYTRDSAGRPIAVSPISNLGGRAMTHDEAALIALHETARSGCTVVYSATPVGGAL